MAQQFLPLVAVSRPDYYPRPADDTGLGLHPGPNAWHVLGENENLWSSLCDEFLAMGIRWVKPLAAGNHFDSSLKPTKLLVEKGLMPIVRFYLAEPYPPDFSGDLLPRLRQAVRMFRDIGVTYFEVDNEPNLLDEWRVVLWETEFEKRYPDWVRHNAPGARAALAAETWVRKAEQVRLEGGIPLLVALAPGGHHDDEDMFPGIVRWLKAHGHSGLLAESGIAVHNYHLKHPLDYPYDAVNQQEHPGAHLHGGRGFSNGFLKYQYVREVVERETSLRLPVFTTEGGMRIADPTQDNRYWPEITLDVHRDVTLQQARYMAESAPEWYMCTMDWLAFSKWAGGDMVWETSAWRSAVRSPADAPIIGALKERGFVKRHMGTTLPAPTPDPATPDWMVDIVDTLPRHPTLVYPTRPLSQITHIVVHHTASDPDATTVEAIARYHIAPDASRNKDAWAGIGYSVVVATDGTVYRTQRFTTLANHIYAHNPYTVGLSFIGNFTEDPPTRAQMVAGRRALAWMMQVLNVPRENVRGHKNFTLQTTACPGYLPREKWWEDLFTMFDTDTVRNLAWNQAGIAYNPDSAFPKEAARLKLGYPVTGEFDFDGNRAQGYQGGILVCRIGDWGNITLIPWLVGG